jgi:hypothetical protein
MVFLFLAMASLLARRSSWPFVRLRNFFHGRLFVDRWLLVMRLLFRHFPTCWRHHSLWSRLRSWVLGPDLFGLLRNRGPLFRLWRDV